MLFGDTPTLWDPAEATFDGWIQRKEVVPRTMLKVDDNRSLGQTRYVDPDRVAEIMINMKEDSLPAGGRVELYFDLSTRCVTCHLR